MCWQCLMERRWRISFSATNHARTQVGVFFFFFVFSPQIFMNADVHIYLFVLFHYAEWHCRSSVKFSSLFSHSVSILSLAAISLSIHTLDLCILQMLSSEMTRIAFHGNQTHNLGIATAYNIARISTLCFIPAFVSLLSSLFLCCFFLHSPPFFLLYSDCLSGPQCRMMFPYLIITTNHTLRIYRGMRSSHTHFPHDSSTQTSSAL